MPAAPTDQKPYPERAETDNSLRAERAETDEELARRSSSIEEDADQVVELARTRANQLLESARQEADVVFQHAEAHADVTQGISIERASEDRVLAEERVVADHKLDAERAERKQALAMLLKHEREQTDERLLTERARADHSIVSRDDFLGMVSHDLRTMLSGISMSAALLMDEPLEGETGKRTLVEAQRIQRLSGGMTRLIGDLLDVVSIEFGKLSVIPEQHDATQLLNDIMEAFQLTASAKEIAMTSEVSPGSVLASFDHERILQVLANLVSNAIKFTKPGGHIALRVEPFEHDVRFTVSDTGCGVSAEQSDAIFERFWQAGRADRRGLGLGLYISRCVVEAHGGRIWAESEPGKGSAFHFTLPGQHRVASP